MKTIKTQVSDELWEKFYRAFPAHGERTDLIRKIIRNLLKMKEEDTFSTKVSDKVYQAIKGEEEPNG